MSTNEEGYVQESRTTDQAGLSPALVSDVYSIATKTTQSSCTVIPVPLQDILINHLTVVPCVDESRSSCTSHENNTEHGKNVMKSSTEHREEIMKPNEVNSEEMLTSNDGNSEEIVTPTDGNSKKMPATSDGNSAEMTKHSNGNSEKRMKPNYEIGEESIPDEHGIHSDTCMELTAMNIDESTTLNVENSVELIKPNCKDQEAPVKPNYAIIEDSVDPNVENSVELIKHDDDNSKGIVNSIDENFEELPKNDREKFIEKNNENSEESIQPNDINSGELIKPSNAHNQMVDKDENSGDLSKSASEQCVEEVKYETKSDTSMDVKDKFYSNAKAYWESVPATIDGMLGGFSHISSTDIAGSNKFLNYFIRPPGGTKRKRALDCGAGIGRITKRLLLPLFSTVDMVEVNQDFLTQATIYLSGNGSRVEKFICCGLQTFNPQPACYDVIWCQWVLGHLTDTDLVDFFVRCRSGLTENGIIIVKENTSSTPGFDETDSSFNRPKECYLRIFKQAGMKILREERQKKFPKEIYDVFMFALQ